MRVADIIDAVLEKDLPALRAVFDHLVMTRDCLPTISTEVRVALVEEVCAVLATDRALMQERTCRPLGLVANSPYSEGVAKLARIRTSLRQASQSLQ